MGLADMPPEIFQHIVHDVVSVAGPGDAWKICKVCRIFAAEIADDIFAKSDQDTFRSRKDIELLHRGLDIFLLNRLDFPHDVNPTIFAKLTAMVDYLLQELGLQGKAAVSDWTECHQASICYEGCGVLQTSIFDVYDNLFAIVACKEYAKVEKLLQESLGSPVPSSAVSLYDPLAFSVGIGKFNGTLHFPVDEELLEVVLKFLTSLDLGNKSNKLLCRSVATGSQARFSIAAAVRHVVMYGDSKTLRKLLDFYVAAGVQPSRSQFNEWFEITAHRRQDEIAQLLIDFAPSGKSMINLRNLLEACQGSEATIQATLDELALSDINDGTIIIMKPLFVAVRSGNVAAVEIMLDRGADINGAAPSNVPGLNKDHLMPLDVLCIARNTT
ncbi:hypothetical protein CC86DRAFT_407997 [Ophiobolus disseminans]|uniref:Uncharacterized protein n=1 Tax=Ophiobolus disseminans TaxID=1469910 RepID=A0A6A6ZVV1_9PLEO|nr:hypothetical protein CC86DRAFT_407997 [Ophiobolus disseminans]